MTAERSTFLLLLVAACLALCAGPALAEPVEAPPTAPPAGAADDLPEGPPPGVAEEAEPVVVKMKALPGRMPDTNGPKIPNVIGQMPRDTAQALSAWRTRTEHVVTDRSYVGRVVDQHPDAGSTLARGEVVTLVVGIPTLPGRGYLAVPSIENLKLEAGVAALRQHGFDIMLRTAESFDRDKGTILAQAPRPASVAPRGSRVIVVVGKGGLAEPVAPEEPAAPLPPPTEEPPVPVPVAPEEVPPAMPEEAPPAVPAEPPVVEEPPAPVPVDPPTPPTPPAEEPTPPAGPTAEPTPPMPPADQPTAPVVVEPPAPRVALRVPTLAGPAAGESYPRAFGSTFRWGTIAGATAYEWELQVEGDEDTWTTAMSETVEGTSFRPQRLEAGRYRWRVRAVADGVEGGWSEFRKLYLY